MAAKLNILNGADAPVNVVAAIVGAEAWFNGKSPDVIKAKDAPVAKNYVILLGQYNEGLIGPGHCDEQGVMTGKWLLKVNNNTYIHDMYIIEGAGGALTGFGGYVAGQNPYSWPYNWTMTGQLIGNAISMTITYQNGYIATITGTVVLDWNSMSGGAGTGGVSDWSATRQ